MIHIPGLTDSMAFALTDIAANRQPQTASARALVRKGLATEVAPKRFALTETGKIAWRCVAAQKNRVSCFTAGETAEYAVWNISKDKPVCSITEVLVRSQRGVFGIEVEIPQTWGRQLTTVAPSDLLKVPEDRVKPQSAPAVHPVIATLLALDIDAMGPIGALSKLYELKRMAGRGES